MKRKQRVDHRRKIAPPRSYDVEKLIAFREWVTKCMDPVTRQKTKERLHPEYKVRWKGYSEKYDLWVAKEDISEDCIKEFNSITIDTASSMLDTVPIGLHPSSPGYAMAQLMSTMVKQKVILKNGIRMPRNTAKKLKSVNTDNTITRDTTTLHTSTSSTHKVASTKEVTPSILNNDDDNNNNKKAAYLPVLQLGLVSKGKSQSKRKFDSHTVNSINLFIKQLDSIITMSKHNPSGVYTKDECESNARDEYLKVVTKGQQKILKFEKLISYQKHTSKGDDDVIKLASSSNGMINGWSCSICQSNSKQTRKDKVIDHILSEKHWNEVMSRATRDVNNSIENKMKDYATLKELPKLIQTCVAIAVEQKSLPFTAGEKC